MIILFLGGELAFLLLCTLLKLHALANLLQKVSWPGFEVNSSADTDCDMACFSWQVGLVFNVHSSSDTDLTHLASASELAWFLMWTLLVTQTVPCLISVCELAWFLVCTLLVTQHALAILL